MFRVRPLSFNLYKSFMSNFSPFSITVCSSKLCRQGPQTEKLSTSVNKFLESSNNAGVYNRFIYYSLLVNNQNLYQDLLRGG